MGMSWFFTYPAEFSNCLLHSLSAAGCNVRTRLWYVLLKQAGELWTVKFIIQLEIFLKFFLRILRLNVIFCKNEYRVFKKGIVMFNFKKPA